MDDISQKLTPQLIFHYLDEVKDPEIPVISIRDLGILQQVLIESGVVVIGIIPTYSGCPAMHTIKADILTVLSKYGITSIEIKLMDDPVWNTDMISEAGRNAMNLYGIAPPLAADEKHIKCPQCGSPETTLISQFGSTACKALYRCQSCLEPFDYFKCHA